MHEIHVECYSGYRAEERPLRFTVGGRTLEITNIDDRWYSPDATHFRVTASDGNVYVLRYDNGQTSWTLDAFRSAAHAKLK
ncbi:MAG TPA: hypothetical protein VKR82_09570 [Candidatus Acidoferrales bacterium]|nr:hypothetical protein [Candidatus Acidoferrales bacterium]